MIPLGLVGPAVPRSPKLTFWLTAGSVLLSLLLWLAPDSRLNDQLDAMRVYGRAHPTQNPPDDCRVALGPGPWVTQGDKPPDAEYERLCTKARELELRSGPRRLSVGQRENDALDWLLHPLVFANPIAALLGWLMLAFVMGPYLEDRWGRRLLGAVVASTALLSALVWKAVSTDGSVPWTGAQGWLSALVAAFTVIFFQRTAQFMLPSMPPKTVTLPAWAVAAWWLAARLLGQLWGDSDRAAIIAEMAGVAGGAGVGLAFQFGLIDRLVGLAGGGGLSGLQAELRRRLQKAEPAAAPEPPRPVRTEPAQQLYPEEAISQDELPKTWEVEESADLNLVALGVRPPTQAGPLGWLLGGADAIGPGATPIGATVPSFDSVVLQADAPTKAGASPGTPAAVSRAAGQDWVHGKNAEDTAAMPLASHFPVGRQPLPPGVSENTIAYSSGAAARTELNAALAAAVVPPLVRLATDVRRSADGGLQLWIGDGWDDLSPDLVQCVAVGLIEHRDWQDASPEIWIDCITDPGGRDRPPEVVRVHVSGESLQKLHPGAERSQAFNALASELASAGAQRLPVLEPWPGPPWPRYATAGEFLKMWQRQVKLRPAT